MLLTITTSGNLANLRPDRVDQHHPFRRNALPCAGPLWLATLSGLPLAVPGRDLVGSILDVDLTSSKWAGSPFVLLAVMVGRYYLEH